jgi:hypothetical protein
MPASDSRPDASRLSIGVVVGRAAIVVIAAPCTGIFAGAAVFLLYIALSGGHYEREPAILGWLMALLTTVVAIPLYAYRLFRRRRGPENPPRELFR